MNFFRKRLIMELHALHKHMILIDYKLKHSRVSVGSSVKSFERYDSNGFITLKTDRVAINFYSVKYTLSKAVYNKIGSIDVVSNTEELETPDFLVFFENRKIRITEDEFIKQKIYEIYEEAKKC